MIDVPLVWLSYHEDNPAKGRWDQEFVGRLLSGAEGRSPYGYRFVETHLDDLPDGSGAVFVFPCGFYAERDQVAQVQDMLWDDLNLRAWALVIATSDEGAAFPWWSTSLPSRTRLWVMTPDPSKEYLPGTRFIGEGSPTPGATICDEAAITRDLDLVLIGQGGHARREQAFNAARSVHPKLRTRVEQTAGFAQGLPQWQYLHALTRGWIAPCPAGPLTPDSFRAYEALEGGCIPILDDVDPSEVEGYWEMLGLADVAPRIRYWRDLPSMVDSLLVNRMENAAHCSARWQQHKRRMLQWLTADVGEEFLSAELPYDDITVIVPCSPVPSNPSIEMIQNTVASIRTELPGSEILITCDGVRDEQLDRKPNYDLFLHNLVMWTNQQFNVWPFIFHEHMHQSGMMHAILPEVRTPYLLYVEHDTPLEGPIPFDDILRTMRIDDINLMRFLHEVAIPPGSEMLFLDSGAVMTNQGGAPYARTIQWSQRPHVARTEWYREIMRDNFALDAKTFIEDVMHGVAQANTYAGRIRAHKAWERFRMAVYAPDGSWKRSGHYDGRAGDPKFPMLMKYPDGQRPEGAPPEGWQ